MKLGKRITITVIGALGMILSAGCQFGSQVVPSNSSTDVVKVQNIRVENYFRVGNNEQVFIQTPSRVFVIGASQIDTLLDLNVGDDILGAVEYEDSKDYPIKASNMEVYKKLNFVPRKQINAERILSMHPDLIIGEESWYTKTKLGSTDYWNRKNVATMVTPGTTQPMKVNKDETVADQMQYIRNLGMIFHKEEQAKKIIYCI